MSKHIKTWVERLPDGVRFCPSTTEMIPAMRAEIAELRAALATPPVASGALPELPQAGNATHGGALVWYEAQMRAYGQACAAAAAPNAALVEALTALLGLIDEFGIKSGVCCCGDGMARHDNPMDCGHSPVDSGEYYSEKPVAFARAALAQAGAA